MIVVNPGLQDSVGIIDIVLVSVQVHANDTQSTLSFMVLLRYSLGQLDLVNLPALFAVVIFHLLDA
jgi:hypothetical protein